MSINRGLLVQYNPSMKLSSIQVQRVAKLANLPLSVEEEEKYGEQLSKILDYIDQLNSAPTDGVEPTFNVTGKVNVMREDETSSSLSQKETLKNGAKTKDGFFATKGVFEND